MGDAKSGLVRLSFNPQLRVEFRRATVTSNAGLLLSRLNTEVVQREATGLPTQRVTLDIDSSESPVHGAQKQSAYNGHFESVCYHPLFVFNQNGDCLAAKLRPGNVHSADGWDEVLIPVIERTAHGGSETRSGIDPGGGVSEVGAQEWHASEHAGPEGRNPEKKPSCHLFRPHRAERQVGERATRLAI